MKDAAAQIRQYFEPVLGSRLRVKPGVGSFLTFEFGPRSKAYGHLQARWRLWIYLSNWTLFHGDRQLVDSDADRKRITIIAHRLEEEASLTGVDFDPRRRKTTFVFNDFRLVVSPSDYLEDPGNQDDYWVFFMPSNEVLAVGPSGIHVEKESSPANGKRQEIEIHATKTRQIRLED
jgi:hypothetical protein